MVNGTGRERVRPREEEEAEEEEVVVVVVEEKEGNLDPGMNDPPAWARVTILSRH